MQGAWEITRIHATREDNEKMRSVREKKRGVCSYWEMYLHRSKDLQVCNYLAEGMSGDRIDGDALACAKWRWMGKDRSGEVCNFDSSLR